MDATIIEAASSAKNKAKEGGPVMYQTQKNERSGSSVWKRILVWMQE